MRRLLFILSLVATLASCGTASHDTAANDDLDTIDMLTREQLQRDQLVERVCREISGQWKYSGPSVEVSGKNLLAGMGKPIAKSKVKKKLNKAYKKLGLNKVGPQVTLNRDGTCSIALLGRSLNGSYTYDPDEEQLRFKWMGIPVNAHLKRDGKKKLHLTFDSDKLLWLLRVAGGISNSSALKAIGVLTSNYEDIMMGFEFKRK